MNPQTPPMSNLQRAAWLCAHGEWTPARAAEWLWGLYTVKGEAAAYAEYRAFQVIRGYCSAI